MARPRGGLGRFLRAHSPRGAPRDEGARGRAPMDGDGLAPLVEEAFGRYLPNRVVAGGVAGDAATSSLPLLAGRDAIGGRPTAYVCRNYACDLPVTDRAALHRPLENP